LSLCETHGAVDLVVIEFSACRGHCVLRSYFSGATLVGLVDYRECELAVQFCGYRNHVGVAGKELLEEPSYSVVSARVATGTNRDYRGIGTSWRNGRACPIRKGPHV